MKSATLKQTLKNKHATVQMATKPKKIISKPIIKSISNSCESLLR